VLFNTKQTPGRRPEKDEHSSLPKKSCLINEIYRYSIIMRQFINLLFSAFEIGHAHLRSWLLDRIDFLFVVGFAANRRLPWPWFWLFNYTFEVEDFLLQVGDAILILSVSPVFFIVVEQLMHQIGININALSVNYLGICGFVLNTKYVLELCFDAFQRLRLTVLYFFWLYVWIWGGWSVRVLAVAHFIIKFNDSVVKWRSQF
jgi:hypothetical protein